MILILETYLLQQYLNTGDSRESSIRSLDRRATSLLVIAASAHSGTAAVAGSGPITETSTTNNNAGLPDAWGAKNGMFGCCLHAAVRGNARKQYTTMNQMRLVHADPRICNR
jgi:hypothetical protein